jgi:hypothetical protein
MVMIYSQFAGRIKKHRLKIAAAAAPVALTELIRQTGLQVLFEFDAIHPFVAHEVDGELNADEALGLMLDGSGLTYQFVNERTVSVRPVTPPAQR